MNQCEQDVSFPLQALLNLVVLLPKGGSGYKTVVIVSMIIAIWSRARRHIIQDWEFRCAGFWDDAVKSSSALQAAIRRAVMNETAYLQGKCVLKLLWDLRIF